MTVQLHFPGFLTFTRKGKRHSVQNWSPHTQAVPCLEPHKQQVFTALCIMRDTPGILGGFAISLPIIALSLDAAGRLATC